MGKLVLFLADGTTLDIPLQRERTTIGRRAGMDICLPYAAVSGEHAVVVRSATGAVLEDLGSTNGTIVNGQWIGKHVLVDGDQIDIGRQKLIFLADEKSVAAVAPRPRVAIAAPPLAEGRARSPEPLFPPAAAGRRGEPAEPLDAAAERRPEGATVAESADTSSPAIHVLNGPGAGRLLHLTRDHALIGRAGWQVVEVRRGESDIRVVPVEGAIAPRVNGQPMPAEGIDLLPGDTMEVAGVALKLLPADEAPAH